MQLHATKKAPQLMSFEFIPRMNLDEDYLPDDMPEAMQHI